MHRMGNRTSSWTKEGLQTPRLRNRGDSWTEREDDGRTDVEDTWEGASPDQHPRTIKRIALDV